MHKIWGFVYVVAETFVEKVQMITSGSWSSPLTFMQVPGTKLMPQRFESTFTTFTTEL